jgi:quercetin dioxygenase-like cupin family protein
MSAKKSSSSRRVSLHDPGMSGAWLTETAARVALVAPPAGKPSPLLKQSLLAQIRGGAGSLPRQARDPELVERASGPGMPSQSTHRDEGIVPPSTATDRSGWRFFSVGAPEAGRWVPLPIPGVRIRELTIDRERDVALLYVEMAAGAVFPEHEHTAPERGIVLRGDFQTGDRLLRAGDFYEAAAGTRHERISSPSGCEGLLWVSAGGWRRWRAALMAGK